MSYKLNKTDGSLLVELVDGRLDNTTADISLIGKNYQGFGEFLNENFIKLLENFANTAPPSKAVKGQVWYDTAEGRLKVYDGTTFKSTDSTIFSSQQPSNLTQGDIWINGSTNQMYFWDGTALVLVGPQYSKTQAKTENEVSTVKDTTGQNKIIVKSYISGSLVGIYSKDAFTPFPAITGFGSLSIGFNISSNFSDFTWLGKASSASLLTDTLGNTYDINDFLTTRAPGSSGNNTTLSNIVVSNNQGISVGVDNRFSIAKESTHTIFRNAQDNELRVKLTNNVDGEYMGARFDAINKRLGLFKETAPEHTLDVNGDARITGDLKIEGDLRVGTLVNESVTSLRIADKNIQLAIPDDSTLLDSSSEYVDDAGLLIETTSGSIKWTYRVDTQSWTTEDNINIDDDNGAYKISGNDVITRTALASTITNAPGLTNVGTLTELTVDDITLNGNRITSANTLEVSAVGTIDFVNNPKIINVATPNSQRLVTTPAGSGLTEDLDSVVATKGYVDTEIAATTRTLSLDVTGLGTTYNSTDTTLQTNVETILEEISPIVTQDSTIYVPEGSYARIHAFYYTANTDAIDVNSNISKTFTAVDSGGVQNVNVVGDFSIADPTATVSLTVTRLTMVFSVVSGAWEHESTVASAV